MTNLIFHHYPPSPVAEKVRSAFGMKGLSWASVEIPRLPPKPLLMPLTGGYRRTPVAQIGADIYGDSQTIFRLLDEISDGPKLVSPYSMTMASWCESVLFALALRVVLTSAMDSAPPEFISDRGSLYFEKGWTKEQMKADFPTFVSQLQAGLSLLEGQAMQNGTYLGGEAPDQTDANMHYLIWFIKGRWDEGASFLAQFPKLLDIEERLTALGTGTSHEMSGEEALEIARTHTPQSPTGIFCANRENLAVGDKVMVRQASDSADPDIIGHLRMLDDTRVSLDLVHDLVGHTALHLPVLGYKITKV